MERAHPIPTIEQAERFEDVLAWIEAHPEQHDQGSWLDPQVSFEQFDDYDTEHEPIPIDCGTVGCIAGWAAHLAGRPMHFTPDWRREIVVKESGFDVPVEDWAQRYFGLHRWRSGDGEPHPFETYNTVEDLRRWARAIRLAAETHGDSAVAVYRTLCDQEAGLALDSETQSI